MHNCPTPVNVGRQGNYNMINELDHGNEKIRKVENNYLDIKNLNCSEVLLKHKVYRN